MCPSSRPPLADSEGVEAWSVEFGSSNLAMASMASTLRVMEKSD